MVKLGICVMLQDLCPAKNIKAEHKVKFKWEDVTKIQINLSGFIKDKQKIKSQMQYNL
jgi:hypothetical protein